MKMNDKVKVYLVHSVKGGSGKSAFSLFKAMTLAVQNKESEKKVSVLYFDADFKGTATKTLLYGKDDAAFRALNHVSLEELQGEGHTSLSPSIAGLAFAQKFQYNNLNDFFKKHISDYKDMIVNGGVYCDVGESNTLIAYLDFIFSSPCAQEKLFFQYENDDRVLPLLNIGWYRLRIQQLLKQIIESNEYQHIVIDMPPGEDEYSRELVKVLEVMYAENSIELYWYSITTNDKGHLDSEYEDLLEKMRTNKMHKAYDRYVMVYNELKESEFADVEAKCRTLQDELNKIGSESIAHVFYLKNTYRKEYYDFCRENVSGETPTDMFGYMVENEKELFF